MTGGAEADPRHPAAPPYDRPRATLDPATGAAAQPGQTRPRSGAGRDRVDHSAVRARISSATNDFTNLVFCESGRKRRMLLK